MSQAAHDALREVLNNVHNIKRFKLDEWEEGDDHPGFYLRLRLPESEGGRQRIYREEPEALALLLVRCDRPPHPTPWFWIGQLVHYGLYTAPFNGNIWSKLSRKCKRKLGKKIERGELIVPELIRQREKNLRAKHECMAVKKELEELDEEAVNHDREDDQMNMELPDGLQHDDSDDKDVTRTISDHSPRVSGIPVQAGNNDNCGNGDTGFVHDDPSRYNASQLAAHPAVRVETTGQGQASTAAATADFRHLGRFSAAEIRVLLDWRDAFCVQNNISHAVFHEMMTRAHQYGNTQWTYAFITKADFTEAFMQQLPLRKRTSMLTLRSHYNWNPPNQAELVRPPRPANRDSRQAHRREVSSDDEEDLDLQEVRVLNARTNAQNASVNDVRATESVASDHRSNGSIRIDTHEGSGASGLLIETDGCGEDSTSDVGPAQNQETYSSVDKDDEDKDENEDDDNDIDMNVSEPAQSCNSDVAMNDDSSSESTKSSHDEGPSSARGRTSHLQNSTTGQTESMIEDGITDSSRRAESSGQVTKQTNRAMTMPIRARSARLKPRNDMQTLKAKQFSVPMDQIFDSVLGSCEP